MKTVSLVEALASGKKFKWRPRPDFAWSQDVSPRDLQQWTTNEILHAECQIIEEPREKWYWEDSRGEIISLPKNSKEELMREYKEAYPGGRPVKFREVCDE